MSTFIKQTKPGNSIEEVIYFIKSYIPIKKNGNWYQAEVVAYDNIFDNSDDAFHFLEDNYNNNTIHICRITNNTFAYIYQI